MKTITMQVGQSYDFDVNATVPPIPAGALSVLVSDPNRAHITVNQDNTGTIRALVATTTTIVTYQAPGFASASEQLVIVAATPPPPIIVTDSAVA